MAFARWVEPGRNAGDRAGYRNRRDTPQGRWHKGRSSRAALLILAAALSALVIPGGARAATVAGVTSGALAVDETGGAIYAILIAVPPGAAGMEPSLSFVYSSQAGNGPLGVGWSLGGLSNVHRCPRTQAQDGAVGGINFDANDRFCIDGQRLIAITGAYGADGTEYRTEIDGFSKIVSYGTAGSGPAWFKVWTKSGQIMEYGNTADSRIEAQGKADVRLWAIGKIADTLGNYLTVGYIEDEPNGEHRLDSIAYTFNDGAGVTAQSSVDFVYEARPDQFTGYLAGSKVTTSQRLVAVKTYLGAALVRDYRLAYDNNEAIGRSRLTSITECEGLGNCLPAVAFDHSAGTAGWQSNVTISNTWSPAQGYSDNNTRPIFTGDWNGDGLTDIARVSGSGVQFKVSTNTVSRLASITDSLGAQTGITFKPITDNAVYTKDGDAVFPVLDIQAPLYVVSEVARDDGLGGQALTSYAYGGAKVDLEGRGFLGFRWMETTDQSTGIVTFTEYRQDFPFIGQVDYSESTLPDGGGDITIGRLSNTWAATALNGGLTVFPHVSNSQAETFEINDGPANPAVTTVDTTATLDAFGNPTQMVVTTTGGGESFVTTTNTYTNDTVNWFLGRLTRAEVANTLPDLTAATRASEFAYDATTGLLTQEVIEPGTALALTTDYAHDAFGNRTTTTVSGPDITTRASTTTYTPDGRFPLTLANALGHGETHAYDARFGTLTSLTGPNGLATTWDYDGFGRKVLEARADGTETAWSFDLCVSLCPAGGTYVVTRQNRITATGLPTGAVGIAYYDLLNRVFQQETEGFDGTAGLADTEFNALGQISRSSRPYFAGTAPGNIQWTAQSYDATGRLVSATTPDGGVTTSDNWGQWIIGDRDNWGQYIISRAPDINAPPLSRMT